jgi:hypothetical protein
MTWTLLSTRLYSDILLLSKGTIISSVKIYPKRERERIYKHARTNSGAKIEE